MNVPLILAGSLAIVATVIHAVAGEVFVVRKLSPGTLPSTPFGGPETTKKMIRIAWHIATIALLTVATALLLSSLVLHGDTARGISLLAASASTGFAALVLGLMAASKRLSRSTLLHPGPALLIATAALAWWGAL